MCWFDIPIIYEDRTQYDAMIDVHVGEIMTDEVVTITQSQSLVDASRVMVDANIKSVIVSDANDHPVGILTSTDFVRMAADGANPTEGSVAEHMTQDIVTIDSDAVVYEAADAMREQNISHLPVVENDGKLIGIVTTTDVAKYVSGMEEVAQET